MNEKEIKSIITNFVDFLLPELTPYETSLYLYLLRNSLLQNNSQKIRIGKRTMAQGYGRGSRGAKTNYAHMTRVISGLEEKGCLSIGDTTREGTEYTINLPYNIPIVKEKIATKQPEAKEEDFFTEPQKRKILFERDNWICQYCGEKVTEDNATLDHYIPQSKGGKHTKENLRTCCLLCNGIKSGKTFEEAAPHILKNIQERRERNNK
jgi:hypothetical protein